MTTAAAPAAPFSTANPHALATILEAAQTRSIIASRDIFDISGIKLWARDQPVSSALQRRLLDRKLRNPLESCLMAEDGVTSQALVLAAQALVERDSPLRPLLWPHARKVVQQAAHLPLHPVAQLLLTAGQASKPESFDHAIQAAVLAGSLMDAHGGSVGEIRMAMLAGLLHDLGEMYIDPRYGEADVERTLDFTSYQQLVVHPHIGRLLLTQLTDYPPAIARAVAEHHERLDGSGYPLALRRESLSPLGRLLAVVEGTLAALRIERPSLARASVALRAVPGEYDLDWVGRITETARAEPERAPALSNDDMQQRLVRLDGALLTAQACARLIATEAETPALQQALALGSELLARLRTGWYASGLWGQEALSGQEAAEVEAVEDELSLRLRAIECAVMLRAGKLSRADSARLVRFCECLWMT